MCKVRENINTTSQIVPQYKPWVNLTYTVHNCFCLQDFYWSVFVITHDHIGPEKGLSLYPYFQYNYF